MISGLRRFLPFSTAVFAYACTRSQIPVPCKHRAGYLVHRQARIRSFALWLEVDGHAVDAVADARLRGPVVEHVALVRAALAAGDLGPHHAVADVTVLGERVLRDGAVERRPPAVGLELGAGLEQRAAADHAVICALVENLVQVRRVRALRALLLRHVEGLVADASPQLVCTNKATEIGRYDRSRG